MEYVIDSLAEIWTAIYNSWSHTEAEVKGAIIGAIGTIFLAWAAIFQIGKQASSAIAQNKHNESLKLKLKIYETIIPICRMAHVIESDISNYIRSFIYEIENYSIISASGGVPRVPKARIPVYLSKISTLRETTVDFIFFIENWLIIDDRLAIFKTAINAALHDINQIERSYFIEAIGLFPTDIPGSHDGNIFPWEPPSEHVKEKFEAKGELFVDKLNTLGSYVADFLVESQNLLVGEMFDSRVQQRAPLDLRHKAISLDNFSELKAFFESETEWGKYKVRIEESVRSAVK